MAIELTTATASELTGIQMALDVYDAITFLPESLYNLTITPDTSLPLLALADSGSRLTFNPITGSRLQRILSNYVTGSKLSSITGGQYLTKLVADVGTNYGINLANQGLSANALSAFFTDLPTTHPTPLSIIITGNPAITSSVYANISAEVVAIATNKNYTVRI
jgi:hypothetical protein